MEDDSCLVSEGGALRLEARSDDEVIEISVSSPIERYDFRIDREELDYLRVSLGFSAIGFSLDDPINTICYWPSRNKLWLIFGPMGEERLFEFPASKFFEATLNARSL